MTTNPGRGLAVELQFQNGTSASPTAVSDVAPLPVTVAGTIPSVALQNVNITQVASVAVAIGHGTAAGALRVELPTDGTGIVGLAAGVTNIGSVTSTISGAITNNTGTITRPADTTAYASGDLIANSTTAANVVPFTFVIPNAAGGQAIPRLRLNTNVTTGWGGATITMNLWRTQPTYTNGDNGAYAVTTGAGGWIGQYSATLIQFGDGAAGAAAPNVGTAVWEKLASGTTLYADMQATSALTPISGQTFTLTAEGLN